VKSDNFEIARFLHLKSEIRNLKLDVRSRSAYSIEFDSYLLLGSSNLRFLISDFRCRNRAISRLFDFTIPPNADQFT
jgi:hypothetical protein